MGDHRIPDVTIADVMDDFPNMSVVIVCESPEIARGLIELCKIGKPDDVIKGIVTAGGQVRVQSRDVSSVS